MGVPPPKDCCLEKKRSMTMEALLIVSFPASPDKEVGSESDAGDIPAVKGFIFYRSISPKAFFGTWYWSAETPDDQSQGWRIASGL